MVWNVRKQVLLVDDRPILERVVFALEFQEKIFVLLAPDESVPAAASSTGHQSGRDNFVCLNLQGEKLWSPFPDGKTHLHPSVDPKIMTSSPYLSFSVILETEGVQKTLCGYRSEGYDFIDPATGWIATIHPYDLRGS